MTNTMTTTPGNGGAESQMLERIKQARLAILGELRKLVVGQEEAIN